MTTIRMKNSEATKSVKTVMSAAQTASSSSPAAAAAADDNQSSPILSHYLTHILFRYSVAVCRASCSSDQTSRCDLSWVESHEAFLSGKHILPNIAQQHLGQRTTPCCLDLQCISCLGLKKRTVISSALNAIGSEWNTDKERDEYNRPATATNAENFSFGCAINRN